MLVYKKFERVDRDKKVARSLSLDALSLFINILNKVINLPYGIVDLAIEQGWTKQLAYFCHIARLHGNGIIYNYNSRKLAKKLNKSHGTVNTHVQFLINKGLLTVMHGHLICGSKQILTAIVSAWTGKPTGKGVLSVKVHEHILQTEWNICARVAINSLRRQKYISRKKSEVNALRKKLEANHFVTKKEISRYKKSVARFNNSEKDTGENVCYLSDLTIARKLARSIDNVRDMIKFWVEQQLVVTTFVKGKTLDTHVTRKSFEALRETRDGFESTYLFKGRVMQFNKRSIEFGATIKPLIPNVHGIVINTATLKKAYYVGKGIAYSI